MGARVVLIAGITLGLLAQPTAVTAATDSEVTIRIAVDGRLLGKKALVQVYDRVGRQTIRVAAARIVRVHPGRVTIVPAPILGERTSTATIRQFTAKDGIVVRLLYRRDTTSRPGPIAPVATGVDGEPASNGDWVQSPDGSRLAFTSNDPALLSPGEDSALFVRDLATGAVAKTAPHAHGGLSWAPDSRRIAFASDARLVPGDSNGKADVYVKDVVTGALLLASGQGATGGAWQDDDHLVLSGSDTDQRRGIVVRTLSTGKTREIVPASYRIEEWQLAPDGRRLVFESAADPLGLGIDRRALYVTDLTTAVTSALSTNRKGRPANMAAWGAVWSPASDQVAFRSSADNLIRGDTNGEGDPRRGTDVFIKDLRSGMVTRVSTTSYGKQMAGEPPRDESAVQWAPNGRMVAFRFATASRQSSSGAVFIKHLSSGRLEPLIPREFRFPRSPVVEGYVFSPDGKRIAFRFGPHNGCWTDLVPFANLNCSNVLVREIGSDRLANVSTLDSGLGWLGPRDRDRGQWAPVWLRDDQLLFPAPGRLGAAIPVIKTVKWAPASVRSPAPWVPSWCDPYRYWWSC